jgi:hypothetical protein
MEQCLSSRIFQDKEQQVPSEQDLQRIRDIEFSTTVTNNAIEDARAEGDFEKKHRLRVGLSALQHERVLLEEKMKSDQPDHSHTASHPHPHPHPHRQHSGEIERRMITMENRIAWLEARDQYRIEEAARAKTAGRKEQDPLERLNAKAKASHATTHPDLRWLLEEVTAFLALITARPELFRETFSVLQRARDLDQRIANVLHKET